ncbi:MAG TPA: hypothetical protein VFT74_09360, partial [Isosphaeraceae bacterium]|nr:hypothetical protein [Isosphaeraceae bacterium]
MTGLNLETFLRLVRADIGPWVSFSLIVVLLALMAWTSWGRKRALRKCLVLSIVAHFALLLYGGPQAAKLLVSSDAEQTRTPTERIREISLVQEAPDGSVGSNSMSPRGRLSNWDHSEPLLAVADLQRNSDREDAPDALPLDRLGPDEIPAPVADTEAPPVELPESPQTSEPRKSPEPLPPAESPTELARTLPGEETAPFVEPSRAAPAPSLAMPDLVMARPAPRSISSPEQVRSTATVEPSPSPVQAPPPGPELVSPIADNAPERPHSPSVPPVLEPAAPPSALSVNDIPEVQPIGNEARSSVPLAMPESPARTGSQRPSHSLSMPDLPRPRRTAVPETPALVHASASGGPKLPAMTEASGRRPLPEIPEVYRSRLAPNRSEIAQDAGASPASEAAVERALEWLARHQDSDGRWNGGKQKAPGGDGRTTLAGETSFLAHCPPGDPCLGECYYWEADTAMTGLALLSFLGAGNTHKEGKYSRTITLGLNFLLRSQKPDGDLRGDSTNVGMYCHAIASLALCEAYALTQDQRLKPAVERAVGFLVKARTTDGLAWRYKPR